MLEHARTTIGFVPESSFSKTRRSLETIYARTEGPFELVCIDGGSPPIVKKYLEQASLEKGFVLVRTDDYLIPNQARNLALDHVNTEYVAFVDNDVLVAPGWLDALVRCADETGAWVVGPLYFEFEPECTQLHMAGGVCRIVQLPDGGRSLVEKHAHPHVKLASLEGELSRQETELIEFHTVLVSMQTFASLGRLDPNLSLSEHADLCLTVRAAGKSVFLEPTAAITHLPPTRINRVDSKYFQFRWSEEWMERTVRRLQEKYQLSETDPEMDHLKRWVRQYRREYRWRFWHR